MSDAGRRRREREALLGGEQAGARLWSERLRRGESSRERLEVAALLGEPGARAFLGADAPEALVDPDHADALREWVWGLLPAGPAAIVRALCAAAEGALDEAEAGGEGEEIEAGRAALDVVRAWSDGALSAAAARERLSAASSEAERAAETAGRVDDHHLALALHACSQVARAAALAAGGASLKPFLQRCALALRTGQQAGVAPASAAAAARAELLSWALGG